MTEKLRDRIYESIEDDDVVLIFKNDGSAEMNCKSGDPENCTSEVFENVMLGAAIMSNLQDEDFLDALFTNFFDKQENIH